MYYPSIFDKNFYEDLIDDMFGVPYEVGKRIKDTASPARVATDVKEFDDRYEVDLELPGYEKEDVKVSLKDGYLSITAEHKENTEQQDDGGKYIRRERFYGKQTRSFYVGKDVKSEDIQAKFTNGILKLTVPKVEDKPEVEEDKYISIGD